jgi:hypothetical protein
MIDNVKLRVFLTQQSVKSMWYWVNLLITNVTEQNADPQKINYDEKEDSRS